jgi:predicted alpha-1,6-mannanase (GH76 family)
MRIVDRLIMAVRIGIAIPILAATAQAEIALQDGSPLTVTHATGTAISQPFTVTIGASVLIVIVEDKGANLAEPATLSWNGQTLIRDVQTSYTASTVRSLAIYHLFNPVPGANRNITGTLNSGVSDQWVTAYTLNGVDTTAGPLTANANTGGGTSGVTSLTVDASGVVSNSWAAVASEFANFGTVAITGTGGVGTTVSDVNDAATAATAGYVPGLSAGGAFFSENFVPNTGIGPQKSNFAVAIFAPPSIRPVSTVKAYGIKFLGNTSDPVTGTAGVYPISGWNNIANGSYTAGTIYSSDDSTTATLTLSGSGAANTWNSGAFPDGQNSSLMNGYQDAGQNAAATDVISGLTGSAYDVFLYTAGDNPRPNSATDYLPNYTINGTTYYTATLDGYDAILQILQSVPASQNSSTYPTTQLAGQYLKISNVVPVGGQITITAGADSLTYRSPLNGIELVSVGNAPQIMVQPTPHRLYTGGVAQLQVQAEGAYPLACQWRENGTNLTDGANIAGSQTTSLAIASLALGNAGNYDVVITNSYGSVTSSVANLNVVVETTADAAFEDWVAAYVVTTNYQTAVFYSLQTRHANNTMWQQAYQIWMVNDVYDCTHSPDQKQLISALINTFMHTQGITLTSDDWDDDCEWSELALIRSYETTGNIMALNSAMSVWSAVYSRGWDNVFGGGIYEQIGHGSKDALSNYPEIIAGMHLYKITGQTNYLTTCETIYGWAWTNLFIATPAQATNGMHVGQVNEGVDFATTNQTGMKVLVSDNSYNSGLFAMAATLLYEATGNTQYLSDAILAANAKISEEPILNEGTEGEEILVRGAALIASQNDYNLWPTYGPWLENNAVAAWNERRTDYNVTWDNFTQPTPGTTNNLDAIDAEAAVLVQQMALAWIPGFATNFTLNYGGTPVSESSGKDWNTMNEWSPYGVSATSGASGYPGSSFEVVVGSLMRNPAGSVNNAFPGNTLQIDGNGATDFNANPVATGEIRFKNSTPGIPSTNYFNNLILNGGELNIGDPTDVILQGQITVQTNSVFGTQGGTGTNQTYRVDSYLTGSGTIVVFLTNSTPSASLDITGTANMFTGQWNVLQGPLVGSGANSLGTNTITIGAGGILETTYPINNPNASLILNGKMFLTQTDTFSSVVINGTPLPAGIYTAARLNSTNSTAFPATFIALYGAPATSASGAIKVGVVPPLSPHLLGIPMSGAGGLTLSATNGTPGGAWVLLQSTNVALPLNQWQTNATGTFDGSGNLSINLLNIATNSPGFYILKVL